MNYVLWSMVMWQLSSNCVSGMDHVLSSDQEVAVVQVRAVFIDCEPDVIFNPSDYETKRLQREELFKYNALRNCSKKLALTVKLVSDVDNFSDDYIPIEHVVEGNNNKRVRLLNPYVLRLRREQPLQAYKLTKLDTVMGVTSKHETGLEDGTKRYFKRENSFDSDLGSLIVGRDAYQRSCDNQYQDSNDFNSELYPNNIPDDSKNRLHEYENSNHSHAHTKLKWRNNFKNIDNKKSEPTKNLYTSKNKETYKKEITNIRNKTRKDIKSRREEFTKEKKSENFNNQDTTTTVFNMYEIGNPNLWYRIQVQLFEKVGTPDGKTVWNDVTKDPSASISSVTPEWTRQDIAIKYRPSEWIPKEEFLLPVANLCLLTPINDNSADIYENINTYEGYIVVPKEDIVDLNDGTLGDRNSSRFTDENEQKPRRVEIRLSRSLPRDVTEMFKVKRNEDDSFLTLPYRKPLHVQLDIEARADKNRLVRDGASGRVTTVVSDSTSNTRTILSLHATNTGLVASHFRGVIRNCIPEMPNLLKRSKGNAISFSAPVVIPPMHNKHFQLELPVEFPCDVINCSVALLNNDNESVAVRDITIKKGDRCFCVWYCDCVCLKVIFSDVLRSEQVPISSLTNKIIVFYTWSYGHTSFVVWPSFTAISVRNKRSCAAFATEVVGGDDPKLLCREMSVARQAAAGLSTRSRRRRARSLCYQDAIPVDLFIVFIGVLLVLLFLGFVKGVIGLFVPCIAAWGIDRLIQTPRRLDHYYEKSLRSQEVQYDEDGWPVHPETNRRTVRFVSRPIEFVLNVIFFICAPCLIVCNACKQMVASFNSTSASKCKKSRNDSNTKKCFSSQDMQNLEPRLRRRRQHGAVHNWMTPYAEELSSELWQKSLNPKQSFHCDLRRPLLHENNFYGEGSCKENNSASCLNSEQNDTEYVLRQMQKSRESLARSQKRSSITGLSSAKVHGDM